MILTHHSLCYLPGERQHVLGSQRIVFIFIVILFLILVGHQRLSAVISYVNAAVSLRESNVKLANVISTSLLLL